jgi:hypothetical protein
MYPVVTTRRQSHLSIFVNEIEIHFQFHYSGFGFVIVSSAVLAQPIS